MMVQDRKTGQWYDPEQKVDQPFLEINAPYGKLMVDTV